VILLGKASLRVLALSAVAWPGPATADFSAPTTLSTCRGADGYAAGFDGRRVFTLQPDQLRAAKAALATDPATRRAYDKLLARADAALARRPGSVMDKRTVPPSGDRHDYLSIAPYWWPDPANPRGSYVRRDGQVNPERNTDRFDRTALGRLVGDVEALGLAHYYSDKPIYAGKAAALIRTWFLDPATAMNPNMNFAQAVPGREEGRAEGVLDTSGFITVIDAVGLIAPSGALSPAEMRALEQWFARYVDWMQTSRNGRAEAAAKNNHGLWYDAQLARFALFARREVLAKQVIDAFPSARIARQVSPDGALPAELARTRSFHYSLYALSAAYDVADSAACLGRDLYGYRDKDGRSLRRATDYVAAYRGRAAAWTRPELSWPTADLERLLARADRAWGPGVYPHQGAWGDGLDRDDASQP
jgi:hypothetical protein